MNVLFVVYRELIEGVGITKKIKSQCDALVSNGCRVDLHYYKKDQSGNFGSYINGQLIENYGNRKILVSLKTRLNRKNIIEYIISHEIRIVYLRYEFMADYVFLRFLEKLKNTGVSIIIEIPTFPYDFELKPRNFIARFYNSIERRCREKMYRYVDRVLTYSDDEYIFKIPTIRISNGIDFGNIPLKKNSQSKKELVCIGVANLGFWHGYDRLIRGIKAYVDSSNNDIQVSFCIIGDGDMTYKNSLVDLVDELGLSEYVKFFGNMDGENLTRLFDRADLAIGSLGRHRSGIVNLKSLKNVEYAARGIPFVYSENDANFDEKDYILKVPADESPVDINKLISFYKSENWSTIGIRESVEGTLSWNKQMKKVVQSILKIN